MSKKLYVGNLAYTTTEDELRNYFGQHGSVLSARIIADKFSGRSRGFGFIEMENDEEAQKAIDETNGKDFAGRNLVVNEARPETARSEGPRDRAPRGDFGRGGGRGRHRERW